MVKKKNTKLQRKKIVIGTKRGGHAIEALGIISFLKKKFKKVEIIVMTEKADSIDYKGYDSCVSRVHKAIPFRAPTKKVINPFKLLKNAFYSKKLISHYNPEIIICMGANNSFFLGFFGKRFGKKVIAVESLNRISKPSKAPLLLSKSCDEVWLPHKELLGKYKGAEEKYIGFYHPYTKLIKRLKKTKKTKEEMIVSSIAKNKLAKKSLRGIPPEELLKEMAKTKTLITNAGITAWEGAELCKKVIVIPLKKSADNHQEEFAKWLKNKYKNVEVRR